MAALISKIMTFNFILIRGMILTNIRSNEKFCTSRNTFKIRYRNHLNRGSVTVPEVAAMLHVTNTIPCVEKLTSVTLLLLWVLLRNHVDSLRSLH
jgi:hypothetical protein